MSAHRLIGVITLLGLIAFAIYYPYKLWTGFVMWEFSGDTSWQGHWMVDDTVIAPLSYRLMHFAIWVPTILATQIMLFAAIRVVVRMLRGAVFERRTVRALQVLGICAAVSALTNLGAMAVDPWILTGLNAPENQWPMRFRLDTGETGVLLVGLGLLILGWVIDLAAFKAQENREMI